MLNDIILRRVVAIISRRGGDGVGSGDGDGDGEGEGEGYDDSGCFYYLFYLCKIIIMPY